MILCQFIDAYTSKGSYSPLRLEVASEIVELILSNWTGLIYFSSSKKRAIYSIIDGIGFPDLEIQRILLAMVGRTLQMPDNVRLEVPETYPIQLIGILLVMYIDCGLLEVVMEIVKQQEKTNLELATNLLVWILKLSSKLLSREYINKVQALTSLFSMASDFQNIATRNYARDKLAGLLDSAISIGQKPVKVFEAKYFDLI